MIVGADKRVSSAFLATLRDEPSSVDLSAAFHRKERPGAILTVSGLTHAITRAEEHMRERVRTTRASNPDIFDTLTATDDCAGPALYRPYIPTPLPPRPSAEHTVVMPRLAPAPIFVLDHHACYPPPPPAAFVAPSRRGSLAWAAIACAPLLALVVLATVLLVARPWQPQVTATLPAAPQKISAPAPVAAEPPQVAPPAQQAPILVVDVKALKPASSTRSRR